MIGRGGQSGVAALSRPLVDRPEGHVHGEEVRGGRRERHPQQRAGREAPPEALPHGRHPWRAGGFTVDGQHPPQRFAVPVLLEVPQCEELGDLGVVVGAGVQQVAQVAGGVLLDVVHVSDAAQVLGCQRLLAEGIEVEVGHVQATGDPLVGVQIERHVPSTGRPAVPDVRFDRIRAAGSHLQQHRHRPVVDQRHRHLGAEAAGLDSEPQGLEPVDDPVDQRFGVLGSGRLDPRRAGCPWRCRRTA